MSDCYYPNFQVLLEFVLLKVVLMVVKLTMIWDSCSLVDVKETRVAGLGLTWTCNEHVMCMCYMWWMLLGFVALLHSVLTMQCSVPGGWGRRVWWLSTMHSHQVTVLLTNQESSFVYNNNKKQFKIHFDVRFKVEILG